MPIHDWTRVPSGLFHHHHQHWSIAIAAALNRGRLPKGLSALVEQKSGPKEPNVLTIEGYSKRNRLGTDNGTGGVVATLPRPVTRIVRQTTNQFYSTRANRIVIKHHLGRTIAVIEIVSPGNKDSRSSMREFVDKTIDFLRAGVHVLIVDLFPLTVRDPFGMHKVIWDEISEEDFELPEGKDRILASYEVGDVRMAFMETVGVGDNLPDMPLFLTNDLHVMVPLEPAYCTAFEAAPEDFRIAVETGAVPNPDAEE